MTGTLDLFGWAPKMTADEEMADHECSSTATDPCAGCAAMGADVAIPTLIGTEIVDVPNRLTIDQRFESFHKANPQVADRMLTLARRRLDRGETFISVKALWEELRASFQKSDLAYDGFDTTKLNNSYTALYARLIIKLEPRLADVIELRKRKGE